MGEDLGLYDNAITSLPTELGALTGLEELYLGSNAIIYRLPTELAALTRLRVLDLSSNQLGSREWPTVLRTIDPSDPATCPIMAKLSLGASPATTSAPALPVARWTTAAIPRRATRGERLGAPRPRLSPGRHHCA